MNYDELCKIWKEKGNERINKDLQDKVMEFISIAKEQVTKVKEEYLLNAAMLTDYLEFSSEENSMSLWYSFKDSEGEGQWKELLKVKKEGKIQTIIDFFENRYGMRLIGVTLYFNGSVYFEVASKDDKRIKKFYDHFKKVITDKNIEVSGKS